MSKFVNSCVNYSESNQVKTTYLQPILEKYNQYLLSKQVNKYASNFSKKFVIPNNDRKYYLLVMNNNKKFTSLYFFPDSFNTTTKLNNFTQSDFFMEVEKCFEKGLYLFEGYMYNMAHVSNNNYLITDILYIDKDVVDCDFNTRLSLVHKIISTVSLTNLNCSMDISIHPVFEYDEETGERYLSLLTIFKNNFDFRNEISSLEFVNSNIVQKTRRTKQFVSEPSVKVLKKSKYIDVYNVFNKDSQNNEGILYVKGLKESKYLRKLFDKTEEDYLLIECDFNNDFHKWYPILV